MAEKRLYIGGLFPDVKEADIADRFSRFGDVKSIEIKVRKADHGSPLKTFAYVSLQTSDDNLKKCISTYSKTKWKGSELRVQLAKDNFMDRLREERKKQGETTLVNVDSIKPADKVPPAQNRLEAIPGIEHFQMKGAPPGTAIPGEKNWVVGKYGRVLPVVNVKKSGGRKAIKVDPSKLTHNLKKINEDVVDSAKVSNLNWQVNEIESEITRRRKGEFPQNWANKMRKLSDPKEYREKVLDVLDNDEKRLAEKRKEEMALEIVPVNEDEGDLAKRLRAICNSAVDMSKFDSDSDGEKEPRKRGKRGSGITKKMKKQATSQVNDKSLTAKVSDLKVDIEGKRNNVPARSDPELTDVKNSDASDGVCKKLNSKFGEGSRKPHIKSNVHLKSKSQIDGASKGRDNSSVVQSERENVILVEGKKNLKAFRGIKHLRSHSDGKSNLRDSDLEMKKKSHGNTDMGKHQHSELTRNQLETNANVVNFIQEDDHEDIESVSSADTAEVICKKSKNIKVQDTKNSTNQGTSVNKKAVVQTWVNRQSFTSEYSDGLVMPTVKQNDSDVESENENDEDEIDDFELYAKQELSKLADQKSSVNKPRSNLIEGKTTSAYSNNANVSKLHLPTIPAVSTSPLQHRERVKIVDSVRSSQKDHRNNFSDVDIDPDEESDDSDDNESGSEDSGNESDIETESDNDSEDEKVASKIEVDTGKTLQNSDLYKKCMTNADKQNDIVMNSNINASRNFESEDMNGINEDEPVENSKEKKVTCDEVTENSNSDSSTDDDSDDDIDDDDDAVEIDKINSVEGENANGHTDTDSDDRGSGDDDDSDFENLIAEEMKKVQADKSVVRYSYDDDDDGSSSESSSESSESDDLGDKTEGKPICKMEQKLSSESSVTESDGEDSDVEKTNKTTDDRKGKLVHKEVTDNKIATIRDGSTEVSENSDSSDSSSDSEQEISQQVGIKIKKAENPKATVFEKPNQGIVSCSELLIDMKKRGHDKQDQDGTKITKVSAQPGVGVKSNMQVDREKSGVRVEDAEKKRLEALKQRQEDNKAQKTAIQKALSNIDEKGVMPNKKIVFDSDSDVDNGKASDDNSVSSSSSDDKPGLALSSRIVDRNNIKNSKPVPEKSSKLFDSSTDDDNTNSDMDDDDARFQIKQQFEGTAGKKLANLQARYGNDERFRLDARFAESGSEEEDTGVTQDDSIEDEKLRSIRILQSVVGTKGVKALSKQEKAKKKFKDIGALKYDPSKEEHKQFEVKMDPQKTAAKTKEKEISKDILDSEDDDEEQETADIPEVVIPEVSKEKFYEMSSSLRDTFVGKAKGETEQSGSFSLLAAFGRSNQNQDNEKKEMEYEAEVMDIPASLRSNQLSLDNRFKVTENADESDGSSFSEDDNGPGQDNATEQIKDKAAEDENIDDPVKAVRSTFFFYADDTRLSEGARFYRKEDLETVREKWLETRFQRIENYKNKHKNFKRKHRDSGKHMQRGGKRRR